MTKPAKKRNDNPTPVRLGELKSTLQEEAMQLDRSLHWLIIKIIKDYVERKKNG